MIVIVYYKNAAMSLMTGKRLGNAWISFNAVPKRNALEPAGVLVVEELSSLRAGDPFRAPCFRQLV